MLKEEFRQAVRSHLQEVPHSERITWDGTKLYLWWDNIYRKHTYLRWERCPGNNIWGVVEPFCKDLIGPESLR